LLDISKLYDKHASSQMRREKPFDKPITIGRHTCWLIYLVVQKGDKFRRCRCIGRFSPLWNIASVPVGSPPSLGERRETNGGIYVQVRTAQTS